MTYSDTEVSAAVAAIDKHRGGDAGGIGAALAVVGLSAERAASFELEGMHHGLERRLIDGSGGENPLRLGAFAFGEVTHEAASKGPGELRAGLESVR